MPDPTVLAVRSRIPLSSIALPVEHGAWGFLLEPLLAGILIAPSAASPSIALLFVAGFLARQPLKFVIGDLAAGRRLARTQIAIKLVAVFGLIAALGFTGVVFLAGKPVFLPLVLATPMAVYLIRQDVARQSREAFSELVASIALSSSIASLALASGFGYLPAAGLWLIMVGRLVPSVIYVRNRLRLEKGKEFSSFVPVAAHVIALLVLVLVYAGGVGSVLTIGVAGVLLVRCALGLSTLRKKLTARQVGIREVIYGVIYALCLVAGNYLGF